MHPSPLQISVCGAGGHVRWKFPKQTQVNFDAVFFLCFFWFPLVPVRAAHVFQYRVAGVFERAYTYIPIRWTPGLVLRAWARRATLVGSIWAVPLSLMAVGGILIKNDPDAWVLLAICVGCWVAFPVVWGGLRLLDRRNRIIRRIIGDWRWGSSDPMTFRRSWIEASDFVTPRQNYNAETYEEAATNCIRIHNWWGAMFAARMVQRFDDPARGRELVERILSDPEVQDSVVEVGEDPKLWNQLLGPGRYGG